MSVKGFCVFYSLLELHLGAKSADVSTLHQLGAKSLQSKNRHQVGGKLKTGLFKPEFAGQLGFYVQAVNEQLEHPTDEDAIGLLICKRKNRLVAENSLKSSSQLLGISEYKLTKLLPADFKPSLPSIKEIESQLSRRR